ERALQVQFESTPSAATRALARQIDLLALTGSASLAHWPPHAHPEPPAARAGIPESVGGAVRLHSPYYVPREADARLEAAIDAGEGVVLIKGSRQMGKTSLLV